jgi:hypothetical protein
MKPKINPRKKKDRCSVNGCPFNKQEGDIRFCFTHRKAFKKLMEVSGLNDTNLPEEDLQGIIEAYSRQ